MRRMMVGVAAALAMSFAGPVFAEDMTEEIQEDEQPGSEIELDIGGRRCFGPARFRWVGTRSMCRTILTRRKPAIRSMRSCRAKGLRTCRVRTTTTPCPTD